MSIDTNAPLSGMPALATPMIRENLRIAAEQYRTLLAKLDSIPDGQNDIPRSLKPDGSLNLVAPSDWTSGFFPGSLWMLFEVTRDPMWRTRAQEYTTKLEKVKTDDKQHDTGFIMHSSYGNGTRLIPDSYYDGVLVETSKSLSKRFNMHSKSSGGQPTTTGLIRSWDWGDWHYPVIIDNLMNLEMLFWASKRTGDNRYKHIAVSHLDQTLRNHFRPDASCYHVVDYNNDGTARSRGNYQGWKDHTAWARGQGWALYGYTMAYRETGDTKYLDHARRVADFIISHPRLPADKVPLWDFDVEASDTRRDSSAAALYASALYELSTLVSDGARYEAAADAMLASLSSPTYQARSGEVSGFLLKHGVGNVPAGHEIDAPLSYGDYYYLEANLRKLRIIEARTLYDRLSDMSKLREASANWVVDSSNPPYFAGDTGRLKRTNLSTEHLVWAYDGLGSFAVTVHHYRTLDANVKVFASSDGNSYQKLPVLQSTAVDTGGGWLRVELTPKGPLDPALRKFRIEVGGDTSNNKSYSPQISSVVLGPRE